MKRFIILFLFILSALSSQTPKSSDIIIVKISQDDLSYLGGWPLNRKWYANVVEKSASAKFLFLNLGYPQSDILHPESDLYFYHTLQNSQNTFILNHSDISQDSIRILGDKMLSTKKALPVMDNYYQVEKGSVVVNDNSHPLFAVFSLINTDNKRYFLTDADSIQTISLISFLQADMDVSDKYIFVEADITGITPYISEIADFPITPVELFMEIFKSERNDNYLYQISSWVLILFIIINCFLPYFIDQKMNIILFLSDILFFSVLWVLKYDIPYWNFIIMVFPLIFIIKERLQPTIEVTSQPDDTNSEALAQLEIENKKLKEKLAFLDTEMVNLSELQDKIVIGNMVCHKTSPLYKLIKKSEVIGKSNINVLIHGESGTGKEKLAEYIHACSDRKNGPFVAVNCGALSESLIESELFGHEAGAFTGANKQKPGRFEVAHNGILFLDEIGETSPAFQVKLLRVIQEGTFERVGGTKPIKVNVRIISATHQNIKHLVNTGAFREDLYYRLSGMTVTIPALRDRKMDIPILIDHFLNETKSDYVEITHEILEWAKSQKWEGNIRQLMSSLERAILNANINSRSKLLPTDFELQNERSLHQSITDKDELADKILLHLRQEKFNHNSVSIVANIMGLHRATISEYLRAWIIRYLVTHDLDKAKILKYLIDDNSFQISDSLRKRIDKYISTIVDKIDSGLKDKLPNDVLIRTHFKNIPSSFQSDLNALIDIMKTQ